MTCGMVSGCATGIITKGLGLPAKNSLVFGMSRLQIKVEVDPTPTPSVTPSPTITPTNVIGRGGVDIARMHEEECESEKNVQIRVAWGNGREINKTFKVDSYWNNIIVKRIGTINRVKQRFDVMINKIKNRFKVKWKK